LPKKLFVLAGETSGDLHAGLVIESLKALQPEVDVFGVGGEKLKKAGVRLLYETDQINYMGFVEVAKHFFFLKKVISDIKQAIKNEKPDAALLVDYPGMNLIIAEFLKEQNIPVIFYIAPQVWAWKEKRVEKIKRYITHLLVVFEFEEQFFRERGITPTFVGHPIIEELAHLTFEPKDNFLQKQGINSQQKIIGLLPGSRRQELERIYPEMLKAAKELQETYSARIVLGKAPNLPKSLYNEYHKAYNIEPIFISGYETMHFSDVVLVTSGTATLETLYFAKPMVVLYKTNWLNYVIGRRLVKIGKFALANIVSKGLAGEAKVVPELLQQEMNARQIVKEVQNYFEKPALAQSVMSELGEARRHLGEKKPSQEVSRVIAEVLHQ